MRTVGTVVRGIRTPVIKHGMNLEEVVIDALMNAKTHEKFEFKDKDIVAITEAVVGITEGNFATLDNIATDIKNKFPDGHLGLVFPSPMSRNRMPFLRGLARGLDKMTVLMSYPADIDIHNELFDEELLEEYNINPATDILDEATYLKYFGSAVHKFTGVNYVKFFKEEIEKENCKIEIILANDPTVILNYEKDILVGCVHSRNKIKKLISNKKPNSIYCLDEIMTKSIDGSGFNSKYGLLGSNRVQDEKLKLFPTSGQVLVENIQKKLKEITGKTIEVMVYADGAFKDPVGGIWELADPVVSPAHTSGLTGLPNEIKLKYISDNKLSDLSGEELNEAMKKEIKSKEKDLFGKMESQGTTPRQITDLIGSLCDLTTGSGDKGTPVVYIQGYFDNYAD